MVTFSSSFLVCFLQHSYFIAPDINGLPTIPESVSMFNPVNNTEAPKIKPHLMYSMNVIALHIKSSAHEKNET